jgi:hypothetical protein
MSIGAVSSNNPSASGMPNGIDQMRQDFQSLQNSLASGDLAGAQNAFAAVQQDFQNFKPQNAGTSTSQGTSQVQQDLQSLQNALSSGDIDSAKQALAAFQQDVKKAHGHHHHNGGSDATSSTDASTGSTGSSPASNSFSLSLTLIAPSGNTSTPASTGSLVNLTA